MMSVRDMGKAQSTILPVSTNDNELETLSSTFAILSHRFSGLSGSPAADVSQYLWPKLPVVPSWLLPLSAGKVGMPLFSSAAGLNA